MCIYIYIYTYIHTYMFLGKHINIYVLHTCLYTPARALSGIALTVAWAARA